VGANQPPETILPEIIGRLKIATAHLQRELTIIQSLFDLLPQTHKKLIAAPVTALDALRVSITLPLPNPEAELHLEPLEPDVPDLNTATIKTSLTPQPTQGDIDPPPHRQDQEDIDGHPRDQNLQPSSLPLLQDQTSRISQSSVGTSEASKPLGISSSPT